MLLLAAAPAPHPLPCSQTGGRFSTSLAPAQRKGSGSLPGSPDMGGGVGGGGAGGTTASWSWAQGLPSLLSRAGSSSLRCPSFPEVQPGPLALWGCLGHRSRSFPTVCKHAGCWVRTVPEPLNCWSRDSMGTRKQQQSGPPGLPYPVLPDTLSAVNVTPHGTIPRAARKHSVE